jgi:hypothetical protein
MLQAVKDGHLKTWPGLTEDDINKHLKLTPAMAMVHMNQRRQNIRSTSKTPISYQLTPDRKIPGAIQQRKLICHGLLCLRLQIR